jgi:hypothetical protein
VIAFSFENLAAAATIATGTTFVEVDTSTGLRYPERPHHRAFTADLTGGVLVLDFGSATVQDVIAPIYANFTTATVQGNATNAWGAPTYSQAITLGRSVNDRYHHAHRPVGFNFRFLRLVVPGGTATDGGTQFALGGIWAGLLTAAPREIRDAPIETKVEAKRSITTEDGRPIQQLVLDDPYARLRATRSARGQTELDAWREIDRRWSDARGQFALVCMRASKPNEVYVMRQANVSEWPNSAVFSESDLEALEVFT